MMSHIQDQDELLKAAADDYGARLDGLFRRYRWLMSHYCRGFWIRMAVQAAWMNLKKG